MRIQLLIVSILGLLVACGDDSATTAPSADILAAAEGGEVRGYVFSQWAYALPKVDPGVCPEGLNITEP